MRTTRYSLLVLLLSSVVATACSRDTTDPDPDVRERPPTSRAEALSTFVDACLVPGHLEPTLHPYGDIWAGDEGASSPLAMPFPFQYLGQSHTQLWVTSNGELGFGATPAGAPFGRTTCPLADPNVSAPIVFAYATDLLSSTICVATTGTAPRRTLVVTWRDAHFYELEGTGYGTSDVRFGVTLSESTNAVDVAIDRVEVWAPFGSSAPITLGAWATVGVQHGRTATAFSCQSLLAPPGSRFHHQP